MKKYCGILVLTLSLMYAVPGISAPAAGAENKQRTTVFLGIELIELAQNDFSNPGPDNYTFTAGFSRTLDQKTAWGMRYAGIHVELSEAHLLEPSPAYLGDFTGVTGALNVQRLYGDYYYTWDLNFLKIQPIMSVSLGYNAWNFFNSLEEESYALQTVSAGVSGRFRFTLFTYLFLEIPCLDLFAYLYKSREPEAMLGEAHIAFNPYFGVFNWIYAGVSSPLPLRR